VGVKPRGGPKGPATGKEGRGTRGRLTDVSIGSAPRVLEGPLRGRCSGGGKGEGLAMVQRKPERYRLEKCGGELGEDESSGPFKRKEA